MNEQCEKAVHVYSLAKNGCPEYQGKYDFRSFVMRNPNVIAIPYSPIDHPFPFLDTIIPSFNSFLLLKENIKDDKILTKEIHHIIWKQKNYYDFKPYLFTFPFEYTKEKLMVLMSINTDQIKIDNLYELWQIKDHQLTKKVSEGCTSPSQQPEGYSNHVPQNIFDSLVMMKIFPFGNPKEIKYHIRVSFLYIGKESRFIGSPLIIGIENPERDLKTFCDDFIDHAPKWVNDYTMSLVMKKNLPNAEGDDETQRKLYENYLHKDDSPYYFQIICKLIDKNLFL